MPTVRPLVIADPEGAWSLVRRRVDEAGTDEEALRDVDPYRPVVRALLDLDDAWARRLAAEAAEHPRVAHILDVALDDDRGRFDRLVGRDQVIDTWLRFQAAGSPWDFWAADRVMGGTHRWGVDGFWQLILELAEAADDPAVLAMVGIGPVEQFIFEDWRAAIERIERDAPKSEKLRRALWSVWELGGDGIPEDITSRVHRASDQPPGTPHRY